MATAWARLLLLAQQNVAVVTAALHGPPLIVAKRGDRQGLGHSLH